MKQKHVLVVDDEEDLTWSISKHLSKDKDKYKLTAVNSGEAAIQVLSQLPVDLVVTDIRMPGISGLDLLLEITHKYPTTKVIIMTAYGSSEVHDEANKRGCFKYIEKPFEMKELRNLILNAVEEKKGFEGQISDFQLSDIIQMNCLGRLSNALKVEKGTQQGIIFFDDGNIIDARVDDKEGEDAFYEIVSWEGGTFSVDKSTLPKGETIHKGWQTLLLEGMRRADEQRKHDEEQDRPGNAAHQKLDDLFKAFSENRSVQLVALFDKEGLPRFSYVCPDYRETYNMPALAPVIGDLLKKFHKTGQELNWDHGDEVRLQYQGGLLKLVNVPGHSDYLLVLAGSDANSGILHLEIKKLFKKLTPLL